MARKIHALGEFPILWMRHEKLYSSIFIDALNNYQASMPQCQEKNEDFISEQLCVYLRKSCFNFKAPSIPHWERPIAPVNEAELNGGKNRKRPDFTCSLINTQANSAEDYEISLHVECKRLGYPKKSWVLNRNYVTNGVNRFDEIAHEYGKRATSGIMIGYMISSDPHSIESEINGFLPVNIASLRFSFSANVSFCETRYSRKHVFPAQFRLLHIWVDLRGQVSNA